MSAIIDFFKSIAYAIWELLKSALTLPLAIISFFAGLVSSVNAALSTLFQPIPGLSNIIDSTEEYIVGVSNWIHDLPDYCHLFFYCLGLSHLFDYLVIFLRTVCTTTFTFLVFLAVTLPTYIASLLIVKYTAKFLCAFVPDGYLPSFIQTVANIELPIHRLFMVVTDKFLKANPL